MTRVAVIGAGVAGITTAKACVEQSLSVTVFEQSANHIGGLWRWTRESAEGLGSVMHSTIVNSSKEMSAFSDYPVPSHLPNFLNNHLMVSFACTLFPNCLIRTFAV